MSRHIRHCPKCQEYLVLVVNEPPRHRRMSPSVTFLQVQTGSIATPGMSYRGIGNCPPDWRPLCIKANTICKR
jgi:hypothetical protein